MQFLWGDEEEAKYATTKVSRGLRVRFGGRWQIGYTVGGVIVSDLYTIGQRFGICCALQQGRPKRLAACEVEAE